MENNLVCSCCGRAYKHCNNCGEKTENWRAMFDTELCRDLFYKVSEYYANMATLDDVKGVIDKHDIRNMTFNEEIQSCVDEVLGPKVQLKETKQNQDQQKEHKSKESSTTYIYKN